MLTFQYTLLPDSILLCDTILLMLVLPVKDLAGLRAVKRKLTPRAEEHIFDVLPFHTLLAFDSGIRFRMSRPARFHF